MEIKKKYLVIGGAGFIGSNLVEKLLDAGHEVIVLDNLTTGNLGNLASIQDKIKFIQAPAMQVLDISDLQGIEGIFHLGMPSTTMLYRANPLLMGEAINEFIKVLELAKRENCKLVYASSSSLYNGLTAPFTEDREILVKDLYTEARYAMERLAKLYNDFFGVKAIGFRFFSVYGPHEEFKKDFANLISQFIWEMKDGRSPILYGDGTQTRDFTFVWDICDGLIAGMNSQIDCDIFNLGTSENYSLNQLVDILNQVLKTEIKPEYKENPLKNYVQNTLADISKVQKVLGWKAKYNLREGIVKIV